MISQFIDVDYNPDAADGRFGRFIFEICNKDQELAAYLQVLYGYAVTGETQEQKFFIEHGSGSNGKSTLNSVVSEVVGKYASQVDSSLFRKKENGSANAPTPEVAKLEKVRIVFCSETNYNELNESKIKAYTGGTKIPARALYHDSFEYMPQFTIIFDGNNMPTINGTDDGIWRRIVVIPFACRFEKDITLKDTLLSEKETILKWLIDGAYQYYQEDWPESKAVKKATDAYRAEENTVGAFIKYGITEEHGIKCSAKDLYLAYEKYCNDCGNTPVHVKAFKAAMNMQGYKSKRSNKGVFWIGISPKNDVSENRD